MYICCYGYSARRRAQAKNKRSVSKDPFEYCQLPRKIRQKMVWSEVELKSGGDKKGECLVAKKDLPKNLCIPYGGVYRTWFEMDRINRHCNEGGHHLNSHAATVERKLERGKKEWGALDAHPRLQEERGVPTGAWPGAFCNQADTADEQNAELLQHDGKHQAPEYPWMDDRCHNLYVKTNRPIAVGEEILVDYGYHPRRQTTWGFGLQAKKPRVKSDYQLRTRTPRGKYGETSIVG